MFKKLDQLILKAFIWPFIATFCITLFVFMMQILWKYIDDLVGKGLDILTLTEFLIYASATLVTLAMPISILLSSIMTFGKLGENFELVAIKSSGVSLLRFMRPLFFVSILLSGVAFLFANYIAPVANLKFAVIYHDIYEKSPAFDLKDGVFYNGFNGFSILVNKKDKDKSTLHDVLIYEQSNGMQDNTIISEKGKMTVSDDKKFLEFHLQNGSRYEEKGGYSFQKNEFINLKFKEYNKLFDLSQLNLKKTSDSLFMNNIRMKTMRQLNVDLDSLKKVPDSLFKKNLRGFSLYVKYSKFKDSAIQLKDSAAQPAMKEAIEKIADKKIASFDELVMPKDIELKKEAIVKTAIKDTIPAKKIKEVKKNTNNHDEVIETNSLDAVTVVGFSDDPAPEKEEAFTKVEISASYPGGSTAWRDFLERNLRGEIPIKNGAKPGNYHVFIQFLVDKEGNVTRITPLSSVGFGMEEEAMRVIEKSGKWKPAIFNGKEVISYRKQPVVFQVVPKKTVDITEVNLTQKPEPQPEIFTRVEIDASYPGGPTAWRGFLERNLKAEIPVDKGAKPGNYTTVIQFIVDKEGNVSDIKPLTKLGYGMEEEAMRLLKRSGKWIPAKQNGRNVTAYRKQPITFQILKQ